LRIITIKHPWAWAIIHGGKDIENRSSNIAGTYRGQIAIHAGKKNDRDSWELFTETAPNASEVLDRATLESALGSIIGVVDLVDVHKCLGSEHSCKSSGGNFPCSPWALTTKKFHLVLANPRVIKPIPYKGFLGLTSIADEAILAELLYQLGE